MRTALARWLGLWVCLALLRGALGQESRFELGRRLRAFDEAWEKQPDPWARARSVPHLKDAVHDFFSFRWERAARSLDRARFAVASEAAPAASVAWATALSVRPSARLVDPAGRELEITVAPFYRVEADAPKDATVHVALRDGEGKIAAAAQGALSGLPWRGKLSYATLAEGDYQLSAEVLLATERVALCPQTISVVANPAGRVQRLEEGVKRFETAPPTTQRATLAAHASILGSLLAQQTLETPYPAARLLAEAEAALAAELAGNAYFGNKRPGEFWITLAHERTRLPVRLMAPEPAAAGRPLPLVIALHGAGGSENMFFDVYGGGKIVGFCRQRGWLLVAPRVSFFGLGMSADRLIAEIDRLYPVDKRRVFLVGHSMGAMQAIALAQRASEPPAAVAAIGGGGRVGKSGPWTKTAFLVIAGDQDFALPGARRLAQALRAEGAAEVRFMEFRDTEHLGIVQAALDNVFLFFDEIAAKAPDTRPRTPAEGP